MKKSKKRKLINKGAYLVNEAYRGSLSDKPQCVVMDNSISTIPAHNNKIKVTYFITEDSNLLAGQNTVALFKIKKHQALQPSALF